jgi:alkyl hydroperoxide reductase subunit F
MLTHEILQAVKGYTANMQKTVTFVLQTGEHSTRA